MKTWRLALAVGLLGLAGSARADLIDRGNGLIYDDVLDITWLQDANYAQTSGYDADGRMDWNAAVAWAGQLVYQGYDDWRLPTLGPIDGATFDTDFSNNATTDGVYADSDGWMNDTGAPVSEMGHMYYVNLANLGFCSPDDTDPSGRAEQPGWGLTNTSFVDAITGDTVAFLNAQSFGYWFGLELAPVPGVAWGFSFEDGAQGANAKFSEFFAWAVRPGDVAAAPLPGTAVLMALGLVGLGAGRRLRRATRALRRFEHFGA